MCRSKKNLITGHCSTVGHFRLRKTPQAWRGCCHHKEFGIQGLCISTLGQMEKGHSLAILKSQQFHGGISVLETLPANKA